MNHLVVTTGNGIPTFGIENRKIISYLKQFWLQWYDIRATEILRLKWIQLGLKSVSFDYEMFDLMLNSFALSGRYSVCLAEFQDLQDANAS